MILAALTLAAVLLGLAAVARLARVPARIAVRATVGAAVVLWVPSLIGPQPRGFETEERLAITASGALAATLAALVLALFVRRK